MECRCYCCVTPRWVWLCLRVPVRNTSASKSCAWDPISSSKFASPSRSLGREFNFVSLQPRGRRQQQPARSAAAAGRTGPQQGRARRGCGSASAWPCCGASSGAACGSGGALGVLWVCYGSGCALGLGVGVGGSQLAQTPLPSGERSSGRAAGPGSLCRLLHSAMCLCCSENNKAPLFVCQNKAVSHYVKVPRFLRLSWGVWAMAEENIQETW